MPDWIAVDGAKPRTGVDGMGKWLGHAVVYRGLQLQEQSEKIPTLCGTNPALLRRFLNGSPLCAGAEGRATNKKGAVDIEVPSVGRCHS
jgi:hypothetical protein